MKNQAHMYSKPAVRELVNRKNKNENKNTERCLLDTINDDIGSIYNKVN